MKPIFYVFFLVVFIGSCTSNTIYKKPNDLIPKKEMIDIMTDIYIANASYIMKNKNQERQRNYMSLIYTEYGVDSARFSRSNLYYLSRIDEYEKMHQKVLERIHNLRLEKENEFRTVDSIKRSKKNK